MGITRTYSVGDKGRVRRLDNLTTPWIAVDPITNLVVSSEPAQFRDVETDLIDGDKVYVIGDMSNNISGGANFYGIAVSTDAGATWNQPFNLVGGDYSTLYFTPVPPNPFFRFYEVSVVDANTIYVCGDDGWVVKSLDGGLSFNKCTQLPPVLRYQGDISPATIRPVTSVHFITPLVGVVGCSGNIFKTIDGGVTWGLMNSGQPLGTFLTAPGVIFGVFISQDQQTIVGLGLTGGVPSFISRSSDAGTTFNNVFGWGSVPAELSGLHLTWTDDLSLWAFSEFEGRIRSVDGGATWTYLEVPHTGTPNRDDYAGHFYIGTNGFYSESENVYQTLDAGVTSIFSEAAPYIVMALWTRLDVACYLISDCAGVQPDIITSTDLSLYVGQSINTCLNNSPLVNFPWPNGCYCISVEIAPGCQGNIPFTGSINTVYPDCQSCATICYLLTDCEGLLPDMLVNNDFAAYVGQVVHLEDCGDTCWLVEIAPDCTGSICTSPVSEFFVDCVTCLPPVIPIPIELHPRKIKPGYDTPGCPPAYTEKVNCTFAEMVFDEMAKVRYGITVCCDEDIDKWDIKKQELDLRALYDPTLCINTFCTCCPPCDVQVVLTQYIITPCPAPTAVVPTFNFGRCTIWNATAPSGSPAVAASRACDNSMQLTSLMPAQTLPICALSVNAIDKGSVIDTGVICP